MSSRTPLSPVALAFRGLHVAISAGFLLAIAYVWWCALTGRRGAALRVAVTALLGEGILVTMNHGDCPLGCVQQRVGDPMPLFQLVLSPAAARRAVPVLGIVAAVGIALLARPTSPRSACAPTGARGAVR
jgi:hypothetical protein